VKLFVYGSLRAGGERGHVLGNSEMLGEARTSPTYTLLDTGYFPAAIKEGNTALAGEVYEIDRETLKMVDWIEGYREDSIEKSLFLRQKDKVAYLSGDWEDEVILYTFNLPVEDDYRVIESGDWMEKNG